MSKADKMFEELGYKKIVEHEFKDPDDGITAFILYRNEIKEKKIEIWNDRTVCKEKDNCYCGSFLTVQEIQAINEKAKELGWLNE